MKLRTNTRKATRSLACAVAIGLVGALGAPSALAGPPTGIYADFANCPVDTPGVQACVHSATTQGSFKFGNSTVPVPPKTIFLQGGVQQDPETFETTWVNPTNGTPALSRTPLNVPGGLTGLVDSTMFPGPLLTIFREFVARTNDVTATAELVGPVQYNFGAFVSQEGPTVTLPLRVKLDNPFLGSNCYIGSSSSPITLKLTTGTTAPPPPNTPISGDLGTLSFEDEGRLVKAVGAKLVDNAFSVPKASGCGFTFVDRPLITLAVNTKEGLPSAAGRNSATLQGTVKQGARDAVVASGN